MPTRPTPETFDSQVIYKLGIIETKVQSITDNLEQAIKGIEEKIESSSRRSESSFSLAEKRSDLIERRMDTTDKRIASLESWRSQIFTKLGFVVSGVSVFWLVFGSAIEQSIKSIF